MEEPREQRKTFEAGFRDFEKETVRFTTVDHDCNEYYKHLNDFLIETTKFFLDLLGRG